MCKCLVGELLSKLWYWRNLMISWTTAHYTVYIYYLYLWCATVDGSVGWSYDNFNVGILYVRISGFIFRFHCPQMLDMYRLHQAHSCLQYFFQVILYSVLKRHIFCHQTLLSFRFCTFLKHIHKALLRFYRLIEVRFIWQRVCAISSLFTVLYWYCIALLELWLLSSVTL